MNCSKWAITINAPPNSTRNAWIWKALVTKAREYRQAMKKSRRGEIPDRVRERRGAHRAGQKRMWRISTRRSSSLKRKIKEMLVPKDPRDDKNVIFEFAAGAGGRRGGILRRTCSACTRAIPKIKMEDRRLCLRARIGVGGIRSHFEVRGKGAYSRLKYESGRASCAACSRH